MYLRMESDNIYNKIVNATRDYQIANGKTPEVIEMTKKEFDELIEWTKEFQYTPLTQFEQINGMRIKIVD